MPPEGNTETSTTEENQTTEPVSFEVQLKGMPKEVQDAYAVHVAGLQNTVKATREERDTIGKQLRDAAKKLEQGSELQKQLDSMAGTLDEANARADFFADAPSMECKNPKAAYAIMVASNLVDSKKRPDWAAIKATAPELFGRPVANGNAGNGTEQDQRVTANPNEGMNSFIRNRGKTN